MPKKQIKLPKSNYSPVVHILSICILVCLLVWKLFQHFQKKQINKFLICSLRGTLKVKKYDVAGNFTEEYVRVQLIKYFLKKGIKKEQIIIEYPIQLGHKGKNSLRVDLLIRDTKNQKTLLVAEVKKNYSKKGKNSAISHQLLPAMSILNCKKGVYYDGTSNSCLITKKIDGNFEEKNFY